VAAAAEESYLGINISGEKWRNMKKLIGRRNENAAAYQSMMKSGENINRENNVGASVKRNGNQPARRIEEIQYRRRKAKWQEKLSWRNEKTAAAPETGVS
jgi:hypothetical protein